MKKRLELLEQLQDIDLQIDSLKSAQNALHGEVDAIAHTLDGCREDLAALQGRMTVLEQEKTELEASHAIELDNIKRSETNMKEIKTNKEYQAVGREIAAARKQVGELETQTLQKLGLIEELKAEIDQKSRDLEELEQNTRQRIEEKKGEIGAIQHDLDADQAKRDAIAKDLPASLVKRYASLRDQRRGQAVAIARDGYCLGCNMNLPPQLYNSLFRGEELLSCPHCQRVLILKQQAQ